MKNLGRNDSCPCGSGKKYKQCCLQRERASGSAGPSAAPSNRLPTQQAIGIALQHHQAGGLQQAEAVYRKILQADPDHPDALHFLGMLAHQLGQSETAVQLINHAIRSNPSNPVFHINLGTIFPTLNKVEEALACFRRALALNPDFAEAHASMGNVLQDQGRLDEALACYRRAISCRPDFAEAHNNLGTALQEQGNLEGALACYRRALSCRPDFAQAHYNIGNLLQAQGKLDDALLCHRQAISCKPDYAEAHYHLGKLLEERGELEEALSRYRQALSLNSGYAEAHSSLGSLLLQQGQLDEAEAELANALELDPRCSSALLGLSYIALAQGVPEKALAMTLAALHIEETIAAKQSFVRCMRNAQFVQADGDIRQLLIRAITEPWGRPGELIAASASVIKSNPDIRACMERATRAWPTTLSGQELFRSSGLASVSDDQLLHCLLENVQVCDFEFEQFLTMARVAVLAAARQAEISHPPKENVLSFYCALARQCFINEFVYSYTEEEVEQARLLRKRFEAAMASGDPIPVLWLVSLACYFPLSSLPSIDTVLHHPWPDAVAALLLQQAHEPAQERQYREGMRSLTAVEEDVSRLVQQQYEENPYPRWVKLPASGRAYTVAAFFRQRFPYAPFRPLASSDEIDILIAGCGTGQHPIMTAQQFRGAKVLAVDLSSASLCYAKRKAEELGIQNIEFAQADIMQLGAIGRQFDIIESVGVLHHLADPMAGWRILLSLLRPGGMMMLGLYSELARQEIVAAREFIAGRGYVANAEDIRRCRQEMMAMQNGRRFLQATSLPDFYGISECRDLLFHVQEHRYSLPQINEMLAALDLTLIGFNLRQDIPEKYGRRFPNDKSMTDLDSWNVFETENPDAFVGMYQFWVQKHGGIDQDH